MSRISAASFFIAFLACLALVYELQDRKLSDLKAEILASRTVDKNECAAFSRFSLLPVDNKGNSVALLLDSVSGSIWDISQLNFLGHKQIREIPAMPSDARLKEKGFPERTMKVVLPGEELAAYYLKLHQEQLAQEQEAQAVAPAPTPAPKKARVK